MSSKVQLKQEEIIAGLVESRRELLEAASALSINEWDEIFLGVWSIKDLLAHLIGWDFTNLEAAKEIFKDQLPTVFSYYDHDWQTYNAGLVARYRRDDFNELLAALEESHQKLLDFLQALPAEEFNRDRGLRSGRYKVTIAWLLQFEIYDEQRHCKQIRRFGEKKAAHRRGNCQTLS
ncbi:MAG: DinB family protein [Anaerolineae bacterium]|nr:DinB family protein [Anaerolineae bacterium]